MQIKRLLVYGISVLAMFFAIKICFAPFEPVEKTITNQDKAAKIADDWLTNWKKKATHAYTNYKAGEFYKSTTLDRHEKIQQDLTKLGAIISDKNLDARKKLELLKEARNKVKEIDTWAHDYTGTPYDLNGFDRLKKTTSNLFVQLFDQVHEQIESDLKKHDFSLETYSKSIDFLTSIWRETPAQGKDQALLKKFTSMMESFIQPLLEKHLFFDQGFKKHFNELETANAAVNSPIQTTAQRAEAQQTLKTLQEKIAREAYTAEVEALNTYLLLYRDTQGYPGKTDLYQRAAKRLLLLNSAGYSPKRTHWWILERTGIREEKPIITEQELHSIINNTDESNRIAQIGQTLRTQNQPFILDDLVILYAYDALQFKNKLPKKIVSMEDYDNYIKTFNTHFARLQASSFRENLVSTTDLYIKTMQDVMDVYLTLAENRKNEILSGRTIETMDQSERVKKRNEIAKMVDEFETRFEKELKAKGDQFSALKERVEALKQIYAEFDAADVKTRDQLAKEVQNLRDTLIGKENETTLDLTRLIKAENDILTKIKTVEEFMQRSALPRERTADILFELNTLKELIDLSKEIKTFQNAAPKTAPDAMRTIFLKFSDFSEKVKVYLDYHKDYSLNTRANPTYRMELMKKQERYVKAALATLGSVQLQLSGRKITLPELASIFQVIYGRPIDARTSEIVNRFNLLESYTDQFGATRWRIKSNFENTLTAAGFYNNDSTGNSLSSSLVALNDVIVPMQNRADQLEAFRKQYPNGRSEELMKTLSGTPLSSWVFDARLDTMIWDDQISAMQEAYRDAFMSDSIRDNMVDRIVAAYKERARVMKISAHEQDAVEKNLKAQFGKKLTTQEKNNKLNDIKAILALQKRELESILKKNPNFAAAPDQAFESAVELRFLRATATPGESKDWGNFITRNNLILALRSEADITALVTFNREILAKQRDENISQTGKSWNMFWAQAMAQGRRFWNWIRGEGSKVSFAASIALGASTAATVAGQGVTIGKAVKYGTAVVGAGIGVLTGGIGGAVSGFKSGSELGQSAAQSIGLSAEASGISQAEAVATGAAASAATYKLSTILQVGTKEQQDLALRMAKLAIAPTPPHEEQGMKEKIKNAFRSEITMDKRRLDLLAQEVAYKEDYFRLAQRAFADVLGFEKNQNLETIPHAYVKAAEKIMELRLSKTDEELRALGIEPLSSWNKWLLGRRYRQLKEAMINRGTEWQRAQIAHDQQFVLWAAKAAANTLNAGITQKTMDFFMQMFSDPKEAFKGLVSGSSKDQNKVISTLLESAIAAYKELENNDNRIMDLTSDKKQLLQTFGTQQTADLFYDILSGFRTSRRATFAEAVNALSEKLGQGQTVPVTEADRANSLLQLNQPAQTEQSTVQPVTT